MSVLRAAMVVLEAYDVKNVILKLHRYKKGGVSVTSVSFLRNAQ